MKQRNQGITLIALIITIIVLLILAGITITTLTGNNGILNKVNNANEETKKKEYEEVLKIIGNGLKPDQVIYNWDSKTYLDEFEQQIPKEEIFQEANINRKNEETIIVITKEGYVYKITEEKIEFIGKQAENDQPKLEESNIIFSYHPSPAEKPWTNQEVKVSITSLIEIKDEYELQYSLDNGISWNKYRIRNCNERKWSNFCKNSK